MKKFLLRWIINTFAVLVASFILKGINYDTTPLIMGSAKIDLPTGLIVATLVLGMLNIFLRPVLLLLSLPLLIFTLGLFTLVINALVLLLVGWLLKPHFVVDGFGTAFLGAFIISIISLVLNSVTGMGGATVSIKRGKKPSPPDDENGPVIDV
ncbi:MAG: phage holin family protein [Verrucomicrobiota bacterium]